MEKEREGEEGGGGPPRQGGGGDLQRQVHPSGQVPPYNTLHPPLLLSLGFVVGVGTYSRGEKGAAPKVHCGDPGWGDHVGSGPFSPDSGRDPEIFDRIRMPP